MRGPTWGPQPIRARLGLLARPGVLWSPGAPPLMLFALKIQKYLEKIVLTFQGILSTFIFGSFLLHGKSRKQDKHGILFYLTKKNRKQKVRTEGSDY